MTVRAPTETGGIGQAVVPGVGAYLIGQPDWFIGELHRRNAPFVCFNTEDYPGQVTLRWSPEDGATLRLRDLEVALSDGHDRLVSPPGAAKSRRPLRTIRGTWVNLPDQITPHGSSQHSLKP